ncbi:MAG: NADH-quinone oxidoreductase subunit F, partial [Candidatus Marinimicrobia bacterium]|nr:NADH-quinone oxidoreductase subunit F [Candidatus Neomarinimicrobiota bacterium]
MTFTPVQLIAVPLFAAFLIPIIDKINKDLVKWIPGLVLAYLMANSMLLLPSTFNAPVVEIIAGWEAPFGITLVFGPL